MSELKPCPFCGGEALKLGTFTTWLVLCKECLCRTDFGEQIAVVEEWNARVPAQTTE